MSGFVNSGGFGAPAPASSSFGVSPAPFFGGGFSNRSSNTNRATFPQQPQPFGGGMVTMYDSERVCPLCCEELDISDREFYPCKCGYQVCTWCCQRIRESGTGLCPACRTPYREDAPINPGGLGGVAATPMGFGSEQQQQPGSLMFGSSPNVAAGAAHPSLFGQSSSTMAFGTSSATTTTGGGFVGGFSSSATFGTRSSTTGGFGTGTGTAVADRHAPFAVISSSPALAPVNTPFGTHLQQPFEATPFAATSSENPFGSTHQQGGIAQSMSFGTSSNVVAPQSGFGSGFRAAFATSSSGPFGNSSRGNMLHHPSPFVGASATTPPFDMSSSDAYDDGMTDEAPASNLPFGQPMIPRTFASSSNSSTSHTGSLGASAANADSSVPLESEGTERDYKLAILQAKIMEKKKKVEEKRIRDAAAAAAAASALRAEAAPFEPSSVALPPSNAATPFEPQSLMAPPPRNAAASFEASSSVAQRNAVRFAESNDTVTRSQLPADLLTQSAEVAAAQTALRNSGGRSGRENLENAVSLVGTCEHMCPDEELLRREREGDIQLLERPVPDGRLHPTSWTLRNTMVKRFRRSAADYKLDVPEWIRPPDVLERVCAYLEEWVMCCFRLVSFSLTALNFVFTEQERDRQGPDPRYKGLAAPPPLDVYQFVWDRTRMVRKDFILQNFVGTGGLVDARAVRCHERIARWHCMCEHQLSHISDFVVMQSQQNVQELGQTMKTLNQFYDDSMGRALVEVPDEDGRETRTDLSGFDHGCGSDVVQGPSPVDYDGTPLANDDHSVNARLIRKHAIGSPHHGTAEPEMRGLYILLTMDNDGGMEVLKYAARLFQERPEVYHTEPVQLALSIYKAKNDRNYARFFSILRSPSTPYLAACLMFKHVEVMRKLAFRICSKTYGGKTRDGEISYDSYPLKRLTALLCFEDDDETRSACRHYNITVAEEGSGRETIYWKRTPFREPKDPDKGTAISLRPRKMNNTIESKLKGATRLAVCRGELSGEGSFLSAAQVQLVLGQTGQKDPQAATSDQTQARAEAMRVWKEKEAERKEQLSRKRQEEAAAQLIQEERRLKELERRHLIEREKERKEAEFRQRQMQLQEEHDRRAQEQLKQELLERDLEAKRVELEQAAARKKAEELERQRQIEADRQEVLRRQEEIRIREEAEQRRLEDEERLRQQAEKEGRQRELRRRQHERRRLELLEQQENERRRREAEALRLQQELKKRVDAAKKILVWRRLLDRTTRLSVADQTIETLSALKSIRHSPSRFTIPVLPLSTLRPKHSSRDDLRKSLERLLMEQRDDGKLNDVFAKTIRSKLEAKYFQSTMNGGMKNTFLFKVAVVFPPSQNSHEQIMCDLIRSWILLDFRKIAVDRGGSLDVRVLVVDCITQSSSLACDAALLVVPPPWSDHFRERIGDLTSLSSIIDDDLPRVILSLCECFDQKFTNDRGQSQALSSLLSGKFERVSVVNNEDLSFPALDQALRSCVDCLADALAHEVPRLIERRSIGRIFFECFSEVIWKDDALEKREDIVFHARAVIHSVINEIDATCTDILQYEATWPSAEFATVATRSPAIPDYFGLGADLPLDWVSASLRHQLEPQLLRYLDMLEGPFFQVIERLVSEGPQDVQLECQNLLNNRFVKRCLQTALLWRVEADERDDGCQFVYLRVGQLDTIIHRAVTSQLEQCRTKVHYSVPQGHFGDIDTVVDPDFVEQIDTPPQDAKSTTRERSAGKRPWTNSVATSATSDRRLIAAAREAPRTSSHKKRQRMAINSRQRQVSKDLLESMSFTRKLKLLTSLDNGNSSLSAALRGTPPLNTDSGMLSRSSHSLGGRK